VSVDLALVVTAADDVETAADLGSWAGRHAHTVPVATLSAASAGRRHPGGISRPGDGLLS
jgi:hypothetical protein